MNPIAPGPGGEDGGWVLIWVPTKGYMWRYLPPSGETPPPEQPPTEGAPPHVEHPIPPEVNPQG
jgi:hypothetical protein